MAKKESQPQIANKESKHEKEYEEATAEIAARAEQSKGETEGNDDK
jgi:hypothetical protein